MDTDWIQIIFMSFFHDWNKFESGFASVKITTENAGEATLAQWCSQIERETSVTFNAWVQPEQELKSEQGKFPVYSAPDRGEPDAVVMCFVKDTA